jgi:hypothetical protein
MTTGQNRRAFHRLGSHEHRISAARIRPAREATVVDVSPWGASIEVSFRLLPGASIDLQIDRPGHRADLKGRVLRCSVARLSASSVCYRAAVLFDRECPAFLSKI